MAKKLKEYYDAEYIENLSDKIQQVYPEFNRDLFIELVSKDIDKLEFGQRQLLIAESLKEVLDLDYPQSIEIFTKILGPELPSNIGMFTEGYWLWPIGKFVEIYGLNDFTDSMNFIKELTKRHTGEFAIRPFVKEYPEETIAVLTQWSKDPSQNVRRLSSEAMRIRLPWAKKLYTALEYFPEYRKILENLKGDPDKSVQKSVANNLNDLYREEEEKFNEIIEDWSQEPSKECAWIIKHGSRTKRKEENRKD